jgi:FKBP12-rapamycin complex-associated protein
MVVDKLNRQMPQPKAEVTTPANAEHPLLSQILMQCMPIKTRDVRQAWTATLLSGTGEANGPWLRAFFQATIEASAVPELVITTRVSTA